MTVLFWFWICVLLMHFAAVAASISLLWHPYRYKGWMIAWTLFAFALIQMIYRRVRWWHDMPEVLDVHDLIELVLTFSISLCWFVGMWVFQRTYPRVLLPSMIPQAAVITIDEFSTILTWNQAATELFGWPAKEAIGQTLMQTIIPPHDWEVHRAGMARCVEGWAVGRSLTRTVAVHACTKASTAIPVEVTLSIVSVPGEPLRVQGAIRRLVRL